MPLVATTTSPASQLLLMLVQVRRVARISTTLATLLLRPDVHFDKRLEQSSALQQFVDDRRSKQVSVLEYVEYVPILDQLHGILTHDGEIVFPTEIRNVIKRSSCELESVLRFRWFPSELN